MSKPLLLLVDGSSYVYRAYHALPDFTTSKGQPTNALFGVSKMVSNLVNELKPDYCAVVFDAKGKTFRHDMYDAYKANRPPMPDDLRSQIEPIHAVVKAQGLPLLSVEGVEADDVIGTLAKEAKIAGMRIVVSTGDKDMAQLVNDDVTLINTMTNTTMNADGVLDKFFVKPEQIIDYLALTGDSSDNIPGVPKVGPKTAAKWLNEYGDIDNLMANAHDIKGKVGESLRENLDVLKLSKELTAIRCDLTLDILVNELEPKPMNNDKLRELYTTYELRSLLKNLDNGAGYGVVDIVEKPRGNYRTILKEADLKAWVDKLNKADAFAFDTETTGLDYMQAELVGLSLAVAEGEAVYIPVAHDYEGAPKQLERHLVLNALKPLLEDATKPKIGHHLKFDAHILRRYNIELRGIEYDTMMESFVLNSASGRHDLDSVAKKYLGLQTVRFEDVAGKGVKQKTFNEIDLLEASPYAAEDADVTLRLHNVLWPKLQATKTLEKMYTDIEKPLIPVLFGMEERGVLVDKEILLKQSRELAKTMDALEAQAYEEAGGEFNLGSPKQLGEILFEKMGMPVIRKTPKGVPSTAEDVLQELAGAFALPKILLEHRTLSKLKSTYTDKLPLMIDPDTGRVHTSYHQAVAITGRLSSSDPNLQNIPIRTTEGRRIREAFVAPKGWKIVAADYSQVELRIMAHLSKDEHLTQAFLNGQDIHQATAAQVFDIALDDVTREQRRFAKITNFGLMYGMSAFGLAKQLGVERYTAQEFIDTYFERYPAVQAFMDATREQAKTQGYVETVFGRRLYLPEIHSKNGMRRKYAERAAVNAPMQGTNADIIKRSMITLHDWLQSSDVPARMLMQVHDELVFEVREDVVEEVKDHVTHTMSQAANLSVPLKVDAGVGDNWEQAH